MSDNSRDKRAPDYGALRLFLVDEQTGNPIPGVVLNLSEGPLPEGDSTIQQIRHLATFQTDHVGYAKFKLDRSMTSSPQLTITYGSSPGAALVLNVADLLDGNDTYRIRIDPSAARIAAPQLGLPTIMAPDFRDLEVSPASIGLIHSLMPNGLCGQLMPTTLAPRRFQVVQILADICNPEGYSCPTDGRPFSFQLVKGKMREYEVTWHSAGTSLGELLNSITLAPCEKVNVVIADWVRREAASRSEVSELQQQAWQQTDHDRLITETLQSSVHGSALVAALGGGFSASIDGIATIGFGGGVSGSTSSNTTAVTTTNQLSEHIAQAASFVAHRRSSVVFQATASEQQRYQTQTVSNYNHCHTLTMMYFQINRNYKIVTDYKGEREVILVKYGNPDFDAKRAYCNAHLLKGALLDPSLSDCFDALPDALYCCDQKTLPKDLQMISVTISVKVLAASNLQDVMLVLNTSASIALPPINAAGWQSGGVYSQTVNLPAPVDPTQVTSVSALLTRSLWGTWGPPHLSFSAIELTFHVFGYDHPLVLYSSQAATVIPRPWQVPVKAELPAAGKDECIEASCCAKKLIGHLNCHKSYYNRIVWLKEDPNDRIMRWSCCSKNSLPFSLIDEIENVPVTVYGDFVVFPVAGSQLVDDPLILPVAKLITMPTPAVYSEGILGQCGTCEMIDTTKFWNWKDSPCPDSAPAITNLPKPQEGTKPEDLKPDVISNLISFSTVPTAPDSILKALITSLITSAESGSKEARALLEKLLDSIKAGISGKKEPDKATATKQG